jgi:hypothetical protein
MFNRIANAFNPILLLVQSAAYPLAYVVIVTGILLWIAGKRMIGLRLIKDAAIGYLAAQWVPSLMKILHEVGEAMAK